MGQIQQKAFLNLQKKKAIAIKVNDKYKDLTDKIESDANIEIITTDSNIGLDIMRHTIAAQVLAKAVKNLYPEAKLAIGPTIENGFYYDVLFQKPISAEDLPKIENEMRKIISTGNKINIQYVAPSTAEESAYRMQIILELAVIIDNSYFTVDCGIWNLMHSSVLGKT